jgi:hypothetical protein
MRISSAWTRGIQMNPLGFDPMTEEARSANVANAPRKISPRPASRVSGDIVHIFSRNTPPFSQAPKIHKHSLSFKVRIARTPQELQAACRVRALSYGNHLPQLHATLMEPDLLDADENTVVVLCVDKASDAAVGTARFQTNAGGLLLIEHSVTVPESMRSDTRAEITRLSAVAGADPLVKLCLMKASYLFCMATQVRWMVAVEREGQTLFGGANGIDIGHAFDLAPKIVGNALDTHLARIDPRNVYQVGHQAEQVRPGSLHQFHPLLDQRVCSLDVHQSRHSQHPMDGRTKLVADRAEKLGLYGQLALNQFQGFRTLGGDPPGMDTQQENLAQLGFRATRRDEDPDQKQGEPHRAVRAELVGAQKQTQNHRHGSA